ncbi:hypothetical protein SAY86_006960 [Trapa natans]|uniref:Uncharacterized protein n=1 Tax=Trapa natans TaxID=22666 RepID=A0AAN7QUQ2_TRANT|nr:hypothetical protein SAY86_006960 [Trapa natans]
MDQGQAVSNPGSSFLVAPQYPGTQVLSLAKEIIPCNSELDEEVQKDPNSDPRRGSGITERTEARGHDHRVDGQALLFSLELYCGIQEFHAHCLMVYILKVCIMLQHSLHHFSDA